MNIAIITGASSGVGREFAYEIIEQYNLDEVWLIARRKDRLAEIAEKYPNNNIRILAYDLTKQETYDKLNILLSEYKPNIKILISNAGISSIGKFENTSFENLMNLIELNVKSYVAVTKMCLPYISDGGEIIEISSTGAFAPVENVALYSASKVFVFYFAKAIQRELKSRNINVCVVCPGNMNTEMANLLKAKSENSMLDSIPFLNVRDVVTGSLRAVRKGKSMYIPGLFYKAYYGISKIVPQAVIMRFNKG